MIGTVFASILLVTLVMLVIGWFKMISYFYMMRFGIKKPSLISRLVRNNRKQAKSPIDAEGFRFKTHHVHDMSRSDFDLTQIEIPQDLDVKHSHS